MGVPTNGLAAFAYFALSGNPQLAKKIKFGSGHALGVGAYRAQLHMGRGRSPYGAHWGDSLPLANSFGKKGRGLAGFVATSAGLMLG